MKLLGFPEVELPPPPSSLPHRSSRGAPIVSSAQPLKLAPLDEYNPPRLVISVDPPDARGYLTGIAINERREEYPSDDEPITFAILVEDSFGTHMPMFREGDWLHLTFRSGDTRPIRVCAAVQIP